MTNKSQSGREVWVEALELVPLSSKTLDGRGLAGAGGRAPLKHGSQQGPLAQPSGLQCGWSEGVAVGLRDQAAEGPGRRTRGGLGQRCQGLRLGWVERWGRADSRGLKKVQLAGLNGLGGKERAESEMPPCF